MRKKVCITGLRERAPSGDEYYRFFLDLAKKNPGDYEIVSRYQEADYILLVYGSEEIFGLSTEEKKMIRERADSIYTYDATDRPARYFPGVHANLLKSDPFLNRFRAYLFPSKNDYIEEVHHRHLTPDIFFSFAGGSTSWLRKRLYRMDYGRKDILLQDTSDHHEWDTSQQDWVNRKYRYAEVLARSEFILCPRGAGPSASRFFESMQVARVPVYLSDQMVFPKGPAWEKFSIVIPEREVARIPEILEPYRARAKEMGKIAREEWEKWFAPEFWFVRIMENIEEIERSKKVSEKWFHIGWPWHRFTRWLGWGAKQSLRRATIRLLEIVGLKKKLGLNR